MTETTPSAPTYAGLSFGEAIRSVFSKYGSVQGRATRSEYWYFVLFQFLASAVASIVLVVGIALAFGPAMVNPNSHVQPPLAGMLVFVLGALLLGGWWIATIVPSIAVSVRRFHDAGYTGWLWFFHFVPSIGSIVVFVFMLLGSEPVANRWGSAPISR